MLLFAQRIHTVAVLPCSMQSRTSGTDIFRLLHEHFPVVSTTTKGLLLSAYLKLLHADPDNAALKKEVMNVFTRYGKFMDAELQQRSVEYMVSGRGLMALLIWGFVLQIVWVDGRVGGGGG